MTESIPDGAPPRLLNRCWPLPALLAWAAAWGLLKLLLGVALPALVALAAAAAVPAAVAWRVRGRLRRSLVATGFPLSALALGIAGPIPDWGWLLPLALLWTVYPIRAWRDAPVYPTSHDALAGLDQVADLPVQARILDAGSGLGHGLQALRAVWPQARIEGVEQSLVLALISRVRCPWATIRHADMWGAPWVGYDLVYLFQRPESMERAWHKACDQIGRGGWLVSLEFEVPGLNPAACLRHEGRQALHVYRLGRAPGPVPAQSQPHGADKPHRPAPARVAG